MTSHFAARKSSQETLAKIRDSLSQLSGVDETNGHTLGLDFALGLLETAQFVVLILDSDKRTVFVNSRFEELTGYTCAELENRDWIDACVPAESAEQTRTILSSASSDIPSRKNANTIRAKDGSLYSLEWRVRAIQTATGTSNGVLAIGQNITECTTALRDLEELNRNLERRVMERTSELDQRNQLLEGSFDASTVALAYLNRDMNFMRVNKAYAQADDREPEFFVGRNHFDLFPHPENEALFNRVRDTGEAYSVLAKPFEYAENPERGTSHWDWTLTPVKDTGGTVTGLVLALRDVSARVIAIETAKESKRSLQEQLKVKDVLLHEIHHRVKNNLQVVSSLLYLQTKKTEDERVSRLLDESRSRVQAMALVHETLYTSGEVGFVKFDEYLQKLSSAIHSSFENKLSNIDFDIGASGLSLDLETAMSCGLIACELITNALKYAFKDRETGRLHVTLSQIDDLHLCLEVSDDGIGIADDALHTEDTLGLTLVRSMANQLAGRLEVSVSSGTTFRIVFPESAKAP